MERAAEHIRITDQRAADVIPHKEERGFVFAVFSVNSERDLQGNTKTQGDKAEKNKMRSPKVVECKRFTVSTVEQDETSSVQLQKRSATLHMMVPRSAINPLNYTKSTTVINLHMVQSATATPRTTHVTNNVC